MLFNEFLQLDETEQVEILWYNGEQIGRRREQQYLVLLYQVEGFYVEVFYHTKQRIIKRYLSFECGDVRLQPYLEKIDISPIYKQIRKQPKYGDRSFVNYFINIGSDRPDERKILSQAIDRKGKNKTNLWDIFLLMFQKSTKGTLR